MKKLFKFYKFSLVQIATDAKRAKREGGGGYSDLFRCVKRFSREEISYQFFKYTFEIFLFENHFNSTHGYILPLKILFTFPLLTHSSNFKK